MLGLGRCNDDALPGDVGWVEAAVKERARAEDGNDFALLKGGWRGRARVRCWGGSLEDAVAADGQKSERVTVLASESANVKARRDALKVTQVSRLSLASNASLVRRFSRSITCHS